LCLRDPRGAFSHHKCGRTRRRACSGNHPLKTQHTRKNAQSNRLHPTLDHSRTIPYNNSLADRAIKEAVKKEYFTNQFDILPHDGDKVTVGDKELTWHAVDTSEYNVNLYHFAHSKNKPSSNVLFWAVTIVNCQRDLQDVRLAIGSNAASAWWVNGVEVIGIYGDRQTVVDDGVSKKLTLKNGTNVIRCAVFNGGGPTDFCARLLDADGEPIKDGFTISLPADQK